MAFDWVQFGLKAFTFIIWFGVGAAVLAGVYVVTRWYVLNKRYKKYTVMIFKRKRDEAGNEYPVFVGLDRGAILKDKNTKRFVFHLRKNNIDLGEEEGGESGDENRELDLPSVPSEEGGEVVFIEKLGPRKFAVGDPIIYEGVVKVKVSEADQAEAMRVFDVNAKYYGRDKSALVSFVIYISFAVLVLVLVVYVLQKFEVLSTVADKLVTAAQTLKGGSAVSSAAP